MVEAGAATAEGAAASELALATEAAAADGTDEEEEAGAMGAASETGCATGMVAPPGDVTAIAGTAAAGVASTTGETAGSRCTSDKASESEAAA